MKVSNVLGLLLIALPFVYLGIAHIAAAMREDVAEANFPPEGEIIIVDASAVHAVVQGEGPDVVLIHGANGNARDFTLSFAGQLAERGYRVITFDRPGFGYSDPVYEDPGSLTAQAARLVAAANVLEADQPIVLGHSLGGAVAMAWATQHPDNISGLIPLSAVTNFWPGPTDALYRYTNSFFGRIFINPGIAAFLPQSYIDRVMDIVFVPQTIPDGFPEHIGAPLTIRRSSISVSAAERVELKDNVLELVPFYEDITVPVEILHGDADLTVSWVLHSEKLATQIDGANLTLLEGIGHMPHHHTPDAVLDAIDRVAARAGLN
ncbi:MAG: alpha/beta hydrolase [Pseudomonadota bacterium]